MTLEITHPEKPTEQDKIDDEDYMLPHHIDGVLPQSNMDISGIEKLELIEHKTPSAQSSVTFENLNGDTDEKYLLILDLGFDTASNVLTLKPNNIATDQKTSLIRVYYSSSSRTNASDIRIGTSDSNKANRCRSKTLILAKTGNYRRFETNINIYGVGNTTPINMWGWCQWSDTTTNITSLVVDVDVGTFTGDIYLYRVKTVCPI